MRSSTPSTLGGFGAILLWSATFALARSLSERLGPVTAASSVYLLGGLLCSVRLAVSPGATRRLLASPRKYLFGCGTLFGLYTVLIFLAVGVAKDRGQLLEVALINYLWPALTILFSVVLLRKSAGGLLVPGTLVALAGVTLVMTPAGGFSWASFIGHLGSNPTAYALALGAAVSWALYSSLARLWSGPDSAGAVELFVPFTGLILLCLRLVRPEASDWNLQAIVEVSVLGAITALAYFLWDGAMRKGDLLLVAAGAYFTPLLSTVVSCVYLGVLPGVRLWFGCGLIVIGSLVSWRSVGEKGPSKANS